MLARRLTRPCRSTGPRWPSVRERRDAVDMGTSPRRTRSLISSARAFSKSAAANDLDAAVLAGHEVAALAEAGAAGAGSATRPLSSSWRSWSPENIALDLTLSAPAPRRLPSWNLGAGSHRSPLCPLDLPQVNISSPLSPHDPTPPTPPDLCAQRESSGDGHTGRVGTLVTPGLSIARAARRQHFAGEPDALTPREHGGERRRAAHSATAASSTVATRRQLDRPRPRVTQQVEQSASGSTIVWIMHWKRAPVARPSLTDAHQLARRRRAPRRRRRRRSTPGATTACAASAASCTAAPGTPSRPARRGCARRASASTPSTSPATAANRVAGGNDHVEPRHRAGLDEHRAAAAAAPHDLDRRHRRSARASTTSTGTGSTRARARRRSGSAHDHRRHRARSSRSRAWNPAGRGVEPRRCGTPITGGSRRTRDTRRGSARRRRRSGRRRRRRTG